jgi:hypothetical protein
LGYLREDVPVGHPQFGKMFPCRCKLAEIETAATGATASHEPADLLVT